MKKIALFIITIIAVVLFGSVVNVAAASEISFTSCHLYGAPGSWSEEYNEGNQKWHNNHMCGCYKNTSVYSERYGFVVKTDLGVFTPDCKKIEIRINSVGDYEYYKGLHYID